MQPRMNLKAIARDATLRGDTKTLFHALDLLERVVPIATFMDFCTELRNSACKGRAHGRTDSIPGGAGAIQPPLCRPFCVSSSRACRRPSAVRLQLDS